MTHKDELLAVFDETLHHKWESMESALKDLTDDEANYQHECYRDVDQYPGDPPMGTVKWHVHHLTHCYNHYTLYIKLHPQKVEAPPAPQITDIGDMTRQLHRSRTELRDTIASLPIEAFDEKVANGETVAEFVRSIARHDAWHSGQIIVARRLYRARPI